MNTVAKPLPVTFAVSDQFLRQSSRNALEGFLPSSVSASEVAETGLDLVAAMLASRPAVLVADLAALGSDFGDAIRKLRLQTAPPDILVLHNAADGGAILKAMRAGAREFFFEEVEKSLRETIGIIARENHPSEATGKLYAFMAAKGGSGVTTLAAHAAASLSKTAKNSTLFADLNWGSPSAAFFLRATPQYTFEDAARNIGRLDPALWNAMVTPTVHGFPLAPPPAAGTTEAVSADHLRCVLQFMKSQYASTVADCGDGINELSATVMESADEIVLVTCSDVMALHHAKRLLRSIQEMGGADRLRIVLNRIRRRPDLKQGEIETMLGHPIFACVPNDYRSLTQACEAGVLLDPEHAVAQSIAAFTARFVGPAPARKKKLFGIFRN